MSNAGASCSGIPGICCDSLRLIRYRAILDSGRAAPGCHAFFSGLRGRRITATSVIASQFVPTSSYRWSPSRCVAFSVTRFRGLAAL